MKRGHWVHSTSRAAFAFSVFVLGCPAPPRARVLALDLAALRVEAGRIDQGAGHLLELRSAGVRAIAHDPSPEVEMSFVYRGPGSGAEPLASGELRRQIGLKLRALDTCNVVYVMWHVEPTRGLHVSVKSNPTAHDHASCGDRGYQFIEGTSKRDVPSIAVGEKHTLAARIDDEARTLRVTVDGVVSWEGALPAEAFAFDGPIGLRSDNGDFDVELRVPSN
jgi:hypothetical protein